MKVIFLDYDGVVNTPIWNKEEIEEVRKNETKLINEIKVLEQQCKKQKEVIDKAIEYCDNNKEFAPRLEDVLDILKEVSK